jgi:hypothetical protein
MHFPTQGSDLQFQFSDPHLTLIPALVSPIRLIQRIVQPAHQVPHAAMQSGDEVGVFTCQE